MDVSLRKMCCKLVVLTLIIAPCLVAPRYAALNIVPSQFIRENYKNAIILGSRPSPNKRIHLQLWKYCKSDCYLQAYIADIASIDEYSIEYSMAASKSRSIYWNHFSSEKLCNEVIDHTFWLDDSSISFAGKQININGAGYDYRFAL